MKAMVILGDGMAGLPLTQLDHRTTLEAAATPEMDRLAGMGEMGLVCNVPSGMIPGSETANLSVLGYDPRTACAGRAALEALGLGIVLHPEDTAYRCNLVTLSDQGLFQDRTLLDYTAGRISSREARELMEALSRELETPRLRFFAGSGYRNLAVLQNGPVREFARPHDHLGEKIGPILPGEEPFRELMMKSAEILQNHPVNRRRMASGLPPANGVWFWGAGRRPDLLPFSRKFGKTGAMIAGVELMKGIGTAAGLRVPEVPGADGTIHTDLEQKVRAAVGALLDVGMDFAFLHVEATDEMGHLGKFREKIQAIEALDSRVVGPVCRALEASGEPFRLLILPDHPTPVSLRTHTADPVPYILYDSRYQARSLARFSEREAELSGNLEPDGTRLMMRLLNA